MIERIGPRWRLAGLLFAVLAIVALPYIVTRSSSNDALNSRDWVIHSAEVKARLYNLEALLRDSEAAIYTILLRSPTAGPPSENLMERAQSSRKEVPGLLHSLGEMTRDNVDQQTRFGALDSIANGRLVLMDQALTRFQAGDRDGAYASMDDVRDLFQFKNLVEKLAQEEETLLAARRIEAARLELNNRIVLAISACAQLLLLAIVVVVSERQIGQRLNAETQAREAVQRSQLIVQTVREPIVMLDRNLRPLLVNNAFGELYGIDPETDRIHPIGDLGNGAWSDPALLQRLADVIARDRELWDYELTQRTVDGMDRFVVINARRLQLPDSNEPALLLTVSDITTRALVEQRVNELNRQLEGKVEQISDVNRELEAFSYSVSHDLRAPLRHVAGFASKLEVHLGDMADERSRHYIEVIGSSARRMAQLIDDLLVFSRLGRGALRLQAVDMQSLVDEARAQLDSELGGRQVEWRVGSLPIVIGDENMLRTVWQNLLGNAIKYTGGRDKAIVSVSVQRTFVGDYEFSITDNGAGFDMQYAGKLFGVFQRLHRASEFPGNGIGLANVRRIISRHGGRTWAEGELDHGATFHFSLPGSDLSGSANKGGS